MLLILSTILILYCIEKEFVSAEFIHKSFEIISHTKDPKQYYGKFCAGCRKAYDTVLFFFLDYDQLYKLQSRLVYFCEALGPLRDQCASLFTFTMFKLINKTLATIDPVKSCEGWYLCYKKPT
ncbi:unnamed protein product [Heterobilharzia americana]|nr:unnamed protein product [Heterobilharzia americana]